MKLKLWLLLFLGIFTTTLFAQKPEGEAPEMEVEEMILEEVEFDPTEGVVGNPPPPPQSSLLWEISGNGLEKPSYLFGTIHIIGVDDYFWTDIMDEKFNTTEKLVLEIDMDNPMMLMISMLGSVRMKGGETLKNLLTPEEYKKVNKYFSKELGMPLSTFDRIKPMFTSMMMAQGGASEEETTSYEMELMQKAEVRGMKTEGLETVKYQMSMFDSIPYETQAQMLVEAVESAGEESEDDTMDEMITLYLAQDLNGLYELITAGDSEIEGFEDVLLNTRNKNWIPKIEKMSAKKPTFFAVGAGHLPGDEGVINLLIKAGYTVTPIR